MLAAFFDNDSFVVHIPRLKNDVAYLLSCWYCTPTDFQELKQYILQPKRVPVSEDMLCIDWTILFHFIVGLHPTAAALAARCFRPNTQ